MPQADGTVLIDTKINTDGAEAGTKDIELAARRLANSVEGLGRKAQIALEKQANAFVRLNNQYAQQAQKVDELKRKVAEYENQKLPTQEYVEIKNQIDAAQSRLDALIRKQEKFLELGGKESSRSYKSMQYDIDELANTIRYAQGELDDLVASGKAFTFGSNTDAARRDMDKLSKEEQKLKDMTDGLRTSYASLEQRVNDYKSRLQQVNREHKKGNKLLSVFSRRLDKAKKSADKANFSIGRMLATSVLFSLVFQAISLVTNGIREGMENLAQSSDDTNAALSALMSALTRLKNAFATAFSPVVEYVTPVLVNLINLLSEAVTWVAQLFAALSGKDTYVKAVKVQQDYADSLEQTGEAAKEAEKMLAPFDELIQISSKKEEETGELLPEDMFTTEEVSNDIKLEADKLKDIFSDLFEPLKNAWEKYGPTVINSVKNAFESLKQAAAAVGESFLRAWNDLGYGERITGNLLQGFANLVDTVGILADRFREAWETAGLGDSIMQHLLDIVETLSEKFLRATEIIKEWAMGLDFTPLLESLDNLLQSIDPIVNTIGDALLWLLNEVLLPLASWTIEDAIPAFFDLLAASLDVVNAALLALQPLWEWLWDNVLSQIASFGGDTFIAFLDLLTEGLTKLSNWISENQGLIQNFVVIIGSFMAAWAVTSVVTKIASIVSAIASFVSTIGSAITAAGGLGSALAGLMGPAGIAVAAIGAIISVIALLITNWDTVSAAAKSAFETISGAVSSAANGIKAGFSAMVQTVSGALQQIDNASGNAFSSLFSTINDSVSRIVESVGRLFSTLVTTISDIMGQIVQAVGSFAQPIASIFGGIWEQCKSLAASAWNGITSFISGALDGLQGVVSAGLQVIQDVFGNVFQSLIGIVTAPFEAIERIVSGFADFIVGIIDGITAAIERVGDAVSGLIGGASGRSASANVSYASYATPVTYSVPTFATGTVIPPRAGLSLAGVGDSLETEYIAPESKMKQAFKDAITEMGGLGNQVVEAVMEIDGTRFGKLVVKFGNNEKNRVGVRMVSEGTS